MSPLHALLVAAEMGLPVEAEQKVGRGGGGWRGATMENLVFKGTFFFSILRYICLYLLSSFFGCSFF
jgi:hypothetical protein